jgi:hypothetical protein
VSEEAKKKSCSVDPSSTQPWMMISSFVSDGTIIRAR